MRSYLYLSMAVGLMVFMAASPAAAQNNKPVRSGTWYEDQARAFSNDGIINVKFALTPSDKLVNITDVSCRINSSEPVLEAVLRIGTTSGGVETGRFVAISAGSPLVGFERYFYTFNNSVFFKIGKSRYPTLIVEQLVLTQPSDMTVTCTIVGTLSDD